MHNIVFLSHFTGSGINAVMELDEDTFNDCIQAAEKLHKEGIVKVAICGMVKEK